MRIYVFTVALFLSLASSSLVGAYDSEISIDQAALSRYAMAVNASGQNTYTIYVETPCYVCDKRHTGTGRPPLGMHMCTQFIRKTCKFHVGEFNWHWVVVSPSFVVRSNGMKLKGYLKVDYSSNSTMIPFEVPVNISYNANSSLLNLNLQGANIQVTVLLSGQPTTLGTVNLSPYFDTSLSMSGSFNNPSGGGAISARASGVSIQTFDGYIKVTGNISY
ncbi:MAG: hypothetical protein HY099_01820 [Nitrospirae bacterium]|nr:hypothetical protein [Nitrospirota bacterium]